MELFLDAAGLPACLCERHARPVFILLVMCTNCILYVPWNADGTLLYDSALMSEGTVNVKDQEIRKGA